MKKPATRTLALTLLLGSASCLPVWAAEGVYQRQGASESIELSNLEEAGGNQTLLVEGQAGAPPGAAVAAVPAPVPRQQAQASANTLRAKHLKTRDKNGEETDATAESSAEDAPTEENSLAGETRTERILSASPDSVGTAADRSQAGTSPFLASGSGYSNPYSQSPGSTASSSSSSSTTGSTGSTGASASAGSTGTGGSATGSSGAPLSGLQAVLSQYRDLMVQEASATNYINSNPAISRRYLAVNRTTYQARIGQ